MTNHALSRFFLQAADQGVDGVYRFKVLRDHVYRRDFHVKGFVHLSHQHHNGKGVQHVVYDQVPGKVSAGLQFV